MADTSITVSPIVLTQSSQSTMWPVPSSVTAPQKPSLDLLELAERLNEISEWIRTPLRCFLRLKQRN